MLLGIIKGLVKVAAYLFLTVGGLFLGIGELSKYHKSVKTKNPQEMNQLDLYYRDNIEGYHQSYA